MFLGPSHWLFELYRLTYTHHVRVFVTQCRLVYENMDGHFNQQHTLGFDSGVDALPRSLELIGLSKKLHAFGERIAVSGLCFEKFFMYQSLCPIIGRKSCNVECQSSCGADSIQVERTC